MATVTFTGVAPPSQLNKPTRYRPEVNGFDGGATPAWQMVPVSDSRFVQVTVLGAKSFTVTIDQPNFASLDPEKGARKDVYGITGRLEGKAAVVVKDEKNKEIGRLDVRVLNKRNFTVKFYLVSDNANPMHTTKSKEPDIKDWVEKANAKVYMPQMNLWFDLQSVQPITIAQDLGKVVDFENIGDMPAVPKRTDGEKRWHLITDRGDTDPKVFNVFMLWDYKSLSPDTNGFVAAKTPITADEMEKKGANFNMCMMKDVDEEDLANIPYLIFAHEAGHYLERMPFHHAASADSALLMREDGWVGMRLNKRDVESMLKRWSN